MSATRSFASLTSQKLPAQAWMSGGMSGGMSGEAVASPMPLPLPLPFRRRWSRPAFGAFGATLLAMALALPACMAMGNNGDRVNPEVPLWYNHRSGAMHVVLKRPLTVEGRVSGETYERGRPEIDAAGNRVFFGSSDRGIYALRTTDGSTLWRFETLGMVQGEPTYDAETGTLYCGSNDGGFYALRAKDGQLLWRFNTGAEVAKKAVVQGQTVLVGNGGDQLFALDKRTGKRLWSAQRPSALGMEVAGYAGPSVDGNTVYFAFSDGHVSAFDVSTGAERWAPVDLSVEAERLAGAAPRYLDVDTTPVVGPGPDGQGRSLYVAAYAGPVVALDAKSGARLWTNDQAMGVTELLLWQEPAHEPSSFGPDSGGARVPARSVLLAASASTGLWALDPATGREIWRNKLPDGGITAPVAVAGAVAVGTSRYGLFLLAPRNGLVIDAVDVGSGFSQTPAVVGHRLYAMSNGGTVLGVQVEPPVDRKPVGAVGGSHRFPF